MKDDTASVEMAGRIETAKREVKPWVERAARFGHAAKGVVFLLTGVLTAATQFAIVGKVDGPGAAFVALQRAPLGGLTLATIGIGLLYYSAWELCRALADPESEAHGRILPRLEWLVGAVIFGFLSVAAFRVAFAGVATRGDDTARTWSARVMADLPLGDVVVGLVGALVIIAGGILLRRGWRAEFERTIDMQTFSPRAVAATRAVVRVGIMARGLVVFLIGVFLVLAAWKHDPSEAIGMEGALRVLSSHPLGPWAVAAVALGLATYGFYEVLLAWRGRFYID